MRLKVVAEGDTIGASIGTNSLIANGTSLNPGDVIDGKAMVL